MAIAEEQDPEANVRTPSTDDKKIWPPTIPAHRRKEKLEARTVFGLKLRVEDCVGPVRKQHQKRNQEDGCLECNLPCPRNFSGNIRAGFICCFGTLHVCSRR